MILSDKDLKTALKDNKIRVNPYDPELIGPSGIDLRLGYQARIFKDSDKIKVLNPFEEYGEAISQSLESKDGRLVIPPGEIVLATSLEKIEVPDDLGARLIPKNSFNRLGIFLFSGTIEPGFKGNLTLTIQNMGKMPVILYPGMPFCKVVFETLSSSADEPYHKKKKARFPEMSRSPAGQIHLVND